MQKYFAENYLARVVLEISRFPKNVLLEIGGIFVKK